MREIKCYRCQFSQMCYLKRDLQAVAEMLYSTGNLVDECRAQVVITDVMAQSVYCENFKEDKE